MIGIYKLTNKVNGKCYIGQSVDTHRRYLDHKNTAFNINSGCYDYPLYRAIRKYGIDNFDFQVLEECPQNILNEKEKYYISIYNSYNNEYGYNQGPGGEYAGNNLQKLTSEQVDEIIAILKTSLVSPTDIANNYGISVTTVHKINVGATPYLISTETYPIRPPLHTLCDDNNGGYAFKQPTRCTVCGKIGIRGKTYCESCRRKAFQKVDDRPTALDLARMIKCVGFNGVGKKYRVTTSAIKRWCETYKIPTTRKELINWYFKQIDLKGQLSTIKECGLSQSLPVKQIDIFTGAVLNVFANQNEALRFLGKEETGHIGSVCRGTRNVAYGYDWQYAEIPSHKREPKPKIERRKMSDIMRPVRQIELKTMRVINEFGCPADAAKSINDKPDGTHISEVCRGKRKSAYGYFWQYADTENT